jgi:bacillithiol synthase
MIAGSRIPYNETNAFSEIVTSYLENSRELQSFYAHRPDTEGFKKTIRAKEGSVNRQLLVDVLNDQYLKVAAAPAVKKNIASLINQNCFTVCTAHQPNLATGPLYVVYKILHAIRLADHLNQQFPDQTFVPVFYMGSEDADADEINHFTIQGKRYNWNSGQHGAVGRMKCDKKLQALLSDLEQQVNVWPHGKEWTQLLKDSYREGRSIQEGMFHLLHDLFSGWGLVVLIADDARLKAQFADIIAEDIFSQKPSEVVSETCDRLSAKFKVQAHPREINLFYLKDHSRERIEKNGDLFQVCNTNISFTEEKLRNELKEYPERFSPNVILRGLYQEMILPNVAFVGGGGEIAYWLQLKELFDRYKVTFPILVLRNSFLLLEPHHSEMVSKLELAVSDLFKHQNGILNSLLEKQGKKPQLNGELKEIDSIYEQLRQLAETSDATLGQHVLALKKKSIDKLVQLQHKMVRAERKKMDATARQVSKLKNELFPNGGLQERVENIGSYYSKYGRGIIQTLLDNSLALEQEFTVLGL